MRAHPRGFENRFFRGLGHIQMTFHTQYWEMGGKVLHNRFWCWFFFYLLLFLHVSTIFALKKKHKNIRVEDWVSQYMKFINFYNNHINPQNILCLFKTSRAFLPKQIEREEKNYGAENCKKNLNKKTPNTSGSWQGVLRKWLHLGSLWAMRRTVAVMDFWR